MIKATELQLGDYVLVEGKIRRVESLTKRKIGFHINDEKKRLYYARLHDVEPIEITEELLKKNEFQFKDKPIIPPLIRGIIPYIALVYEGFSFFIECKSGGYTFINGSEMEHGTVMCKTHYVHELQHAIRLCGVNFEVKL